MNLVDRLIKRLQKMDFPDLEGEERLACLRERDEQVGQIKRL